ncbi:hypothetical protein SAMN03159341_113131 [Paenibacillus sp. 1_12]|uniref:DUF3052 domain-containing protein n=1 Tax=Paenibacillus sp. 1_12 TaxID=1566278 RepID=UPI0008E9D1B8|nr:DUF3052 domain-containing protein [Paenibacillus sp. 1_12]SFL99524.1 hypothetical protein SAMN03159341_113131 [Paenibacillus sp. 1_12]
MSVNPLIQKLQYKDQGEAVLVLNPPQVYEEVIDQFKGEVHREVLHDSYPFVQVFGASNETVQSLARLGVTVLSEDGLLWLCYPKKTSKKYKSSDCSRESVAFLLGTEGFEPVRQIAIDEDWSALRFRHVDRIKSMVREFAVTEKGKQRTIDNNE